MLATNTNAVLGQLTERHEALERFPKVDNSPQAKWIEIFNDVCTVHAAPFVAASLAHDLLWKRTCGVALCSATGHRRRVQRREIDALNAIRRIHSVLRLPTARTGRNFGQTVAAVPM